MPRNWVWNFNPNPVAKTDEVNGTLIGRCAKEKFKKKWMEEVKSEVKKSEKTMRYVPFRRFWAQDAEVTEGW